MGSVKKMSYVFFRSVYKDIVIQVKNMIISFCFVYYIVDKKLY